MELIKQLTPSGEVAVFHDFDQFDGGSVEKCDYYIVELCAQAVKPGQAITVSEEEVHTRANADYVKYTKGPDSRANQNGMALWQLYDDLQSHGLQHFEIPMDINHVFAWLKYGYPVILAIYESSVYDRGVENGRTIGLPYPWDTSNFTHVIVCTGIGTDGAVKVRDTANIRPPNNLRAGPRDYDAAKLRMVSATVVVPNWLGMPPIGFDPTKPPAPPKPTPGPVVTEPVNSSGVELKPDNDGVLQAAPEDLAIWRSHDNIPFVNTHGIPQAWLQALEDGKYMGAPIETERTVTRNGVTMVEQAFTGTLARWISKDGKTYFYGPSGLVYQYP